MTARRPAAFLDVEGGTNDLVCPECAATHSITRADYQALTQGQLEKVVADWGLTGAACDSCGHTITD